MQSYCLCLSSPLALVPVLEQELVDTVALSPDLHVTYGLMFLLKSSLEMCCYKHHLDRFHS